jgi:hypothetical protein
MPNSRIALFPYSNIQGNLTINFMAQMIKIGPLTRADMENAML